MSASKEAWNLLQFFEWGGVVYIRQTVELHKRNEVGALLEMKGIHPDYENEYTLRSIFQAMKESLNVNIKVMCRVYTFGFQEKFP